MNKVLILDFGSQFTQLIARRVRELNIYSQIQPFDYPIDNILADTEIGAIIFSGGPNSIYDQSSPRIDERILELKIPILGVCYGLQLIGSSLGGIVEASQKREYGKAELSLRPSGMWKGINTLAKLPVWMSHGDHLISVPEGFKIICSSENCPIAGIANDQKKIYGLQFHPEVLHTKYGSEILSNFLDIAGLQRDWDPKGYIQKTVASIRSKVGDKKVLCGLSGGVDSSVVAVLIHKAIGDNLHCMFVDHGLLRAGERQQVEKMFRDNYNINLTVVDSSELFLSRLEGVVDPEQKRKIIGNSFIEVFESESKKIGDFEFLAQGTLYPDVVESVSVNGGPSQVIKSHHNVGGLPEKMKFELIEPLRELFKDEVRKVGLELMMPAEMVNRHPFPGPGLAIRIIGEVDRAKIQILQQADDIFIQELKGYYQNINEITKSKYLNVWEDYMPRYSVDKRECAHAIIYNPKTKKYLVQQTHNNPDYLYNLHLVGGGIHTGEDMLEGLFREVAEETGLRPSQFNTPKYLGKVINGFFVPYYHRNREILSHIYYMETDSQLENIKDRDDETVVSKWVDLFETKDNLLPAFEWVINNYQQIPEAISLYEKTWQAFCVLTPIQTVGVMGDGRTYENVLVLRAVTAADGMTADWARLPFDFLSKVSGRITNEVKGINRVVYDISSKPPATIEWE
jgi:GMP synthase (glutamine-hydrolysing)